MLTSAGNICFFLVVLKRVESLSNDESQQSCAEESSTKLLVSATNSAPHFCSRQQRMHSSGPVLVSVVPVLELMLIFDSAELVPQNP